MSRRDDLVPTPHRKAEKWTRISDYMRGSDAQSFFFGERTERQDSKPPRISRRGLWLPIYILGIAAALLWMSGALDRSISDVGADPQAAPVQQAATSSTGVAFGICDQGGGTNCVVDGDNFYLGGENIRLAGVSAPRTHSAACDAEALLGAAATERLQAALNSGTVTIRGGEPVRDANGRHVRTVLVDGRDVAQTLVAAGLARPGADGERPSWC